MKANPIKNFIDKLTALRFLSAIRDFKAPAERKARVMGQVLNFMAEYPYEKKRMTFMESARAFLNFTPLKVAMAVLALALVSGGTGTVLLANSSLPGDFLYPVKINVNEKIASALVFSSKEKAELQVKFTEIRLDEMEKLAEADKLDDKTKEQASAQLKNNASQANKALSELEKEGHAGIAANISSDLEASLKGHGRVLFEMSKENKNITPAVNSIILEIKGKSDETADVRSKSEAKLFAGPKPEADAALNKKLKEAQDAIYEMQTIFENSKDNLNEDDLKNIGKILKIAVQNFENGKNEMEAGSNSDAFALFQKAIRENQELKLFVNAKLNPDEAANGKAGNGDKNSKRNDRNKEENSPAFENAARPQTQPAPDAGGENSADLEIRNWLNAQ